MTQNLSDNSLKKSAVIISVLVAILLAFLKFVAFLKTDSLAIFSSFIDSITDLFASTVSFAAVYFSTKPASVSHRFGYGKTEALSALLQAVFVGVSGLFVIYDGVKRLIHPVNLAETNIGIAVMLFSILATVFLVIYQTYVANKTKSLAIKADRAHYTVDFLTNSAVVISLILVYFFNFSYFDSIAALFISLYLLYNAYDLSKEAIELITDKELPEEIRNNVEQIVLKCKGVHGMHDFRSRNLGNTYYFEIHLEINGFIPLFKAHEISANVENEILKVYPQSQVLIHQDPVGVHEARLDHEINGVCDIN